MADIVREGGHPKQRLFSEGDRLLLGQTLTRRERPSVAPNRLNHTLRLVQYTNAVLEPGVVRTRKYMTRQAELVDPPKSLQKR
jgi:hypothetical protein